MHPSINQVSQAVDQSLTSRIFIFLFRRPTARYTGQVEQEQRWQGRQRRHRHLLSASGSGRGRLWRVSVLSRLALSRSCCLNIVLSVSICSGAKYRIPYTQYRRYGFFSNWVVVAFSSRARILGECSTIHSSPALFFFFFSFLSGD